MILPNDVPNATTELRKRRSTRIVQAVPLVVMGVDALGRPFQERTSTLIVNCHGCRYQSKHYVLKNMWVEMEIPHPEQGSSPRMVRGRVAWIQRPRTIRQLFQVAVELDVPGNIWSIAFPPEDWSAYPEPAAGDGYLADEADEPDDAEEDQESRGIVRRREVAAEKAELDLHLFSGAGRDTTDPPGEELGALLAEAKGQIQAATREAIQQAVASESRAAVQDWQARLAEAREHLREELARAIESVRREAEMKARAAHRAAAETLKNELPGWLAPQFEELTREIAEQLRKADAARKAEEDRRAQEAAESAREAQTPEARAGEFAARLDALQQEAAEGFRVHIERILEQHREEMKKQSLQAIEDTNQRMQGAIANSEREAARIEEQIRSQAQPQLAGAEEALQRLAGARALVDGALSMQEERVRQMTGEAFDEALAAFRERMERTEREIVSRADARMAGRLEEMEKRSGQLQHSTANSLFQSAEWYEKKAQTQIQQALDKGIEQASAQLRERAGEISGVFATEVDHHSRNFVQHAQTQMEEVLRDAFERARALFSEAAETTSAAFSDEIQRNGRQELEGFSGALKMAVAESRGQVEILRQSLGAQMSAEQESFLRRFREGMGTAVEAGVNQAQRQVDGGLQEVLDSWRAMTEKHQEKMRALYGQIGDESVDRYRGRLENVSNSWMVAATTMMDRQSRDVLDTVAHSAEERLRTACAQAFANIADTLREQLKEISANFVPPPSSGKPMH